MVVLVFTTRGSGSVDEKGNTVGTYLYSAFVKTEKSHETLENIIEKV